MDKPPDTSPRKRGRPKLEKPRRKRIPLPCTVDEVLAIRIGARAMRTTKRPQGLPHAVYARLMALYGRVKPKVAARVLAQWGYGDLLPARDVPPRGEGQGVLALDDGTEEDET